MTTPSTSAASDPAPHKVTTAGGPTTSAPRLVALDGLRGLASLMVVLTHVGLAAPLATNLTLSSWLSRPDLVLVSLASDGSTAVTIFFVLSGLVLVLPMVGEKRARDLPRWAAYYPRRLLRLYVPVWGSILLAIGWYVAVTPRTTPWTTDWVASHDQPILLRPLLAAFELRRTTFLNSPLWSLHYEVVFSLLLPVYVLIASWGPTWARRLLPPAIAVTGLGALVGSDLLVMLPQFLVGALLAAQRERLHAWLHSLSASSGLALVTLSLVLTQSAAVLTWVGPTWSLGFAWPLRVTGSAILVMLFMGWWPAQRLSSTRVVSWLGAMSFSLYLVHEPLVVSLRLLLGPSATYTQLLVAALPASLALAAVFWWVVERPAHELSRWVGARILGWLDSRRLGSRRLGQGRNP